MRNAIQLVSVDLGGSWIRAVAFDTQGHAIHQLKAPATTLINLPFFLKRSFTRWRIRPEVLWVGTKGVWTPAERRRATASLKRLAKQVKVISDVEAAWLATFGKLGAGVIVISGTGSIALGRDRHDHQVRRGGLGPLLGDEGSAFWIGKEWLKQSDQGRASHAVLGILRTPAESVRRIAALATQVIGKARRGHPAARAIIAEAQRQLGMLVLGAADSLRLPNPVPVSWSGSVLQNPWFRRGFLQTLRAQARHSHRTVRPVIPRHDAVAALAQAYFSPFEKGGSRGILP